MHDLTEIMHKAPHVPLRVDAALRLEFPTGRHVQPHHHQTWELVYFLEGDAWCPTGDEVFEGHPGTLLLTPPRTSHHEIVDGPWACYCIEIEAPRDHPWPRVYHDDANGTFANLCSILVREWTGQQPGRDGMIALLLAQFDILLQRTYEHN